MRHVLLTLAAAGILVTTMTAADQADETTVIKRDSATESTTVIKKEKELHALPVPHTEEHTTIIKKEHDE